MTVRQKLLAGAIVSALSPVQTGSAATIIVDTAVDGSPLPGVDICTLRLAVEAANINAAVSGCAAGSLSEPDVIQLDPAVLGDTITVLDGEILIQSSVTIENTQSPRRSMSISGNNYSRIFNVDDEVTSNVIDVTLRGLALVDGRAQEGWGGAVRVNREHLRVERCTFENNRVTDLYTRGGAIANFMGEVTITESTFSGNSAVRSGGGLFTLAGTLSMTNAVVQNNSAQNGGGIGGEPDSDNNTPTIDIEGGVVSGNTANQYGGGMLASGAVTLTGVEIAQNTAGQDGGGIDAGSNSSLTLNDVSLAENTSGNNGGGIRAGSFSVLEINDSRIIGNQSSFAGGGILASGFTTISASLLSGNVADVSEGTSGGGAIFHSGSNLTINDSEISLNSANYGGGISASGPMSISGSTLTANTATSTGGGIYARDGLNLIQSTLTGNLANFGAAVRNTNLGTMTIESATLYANSAIEVLGSAAAFAAISSTKPFTIRNSTLIANAPFGVASEAGGGPWSMYNTVIFDSAISDCLNVELPPTQNVNNFIGDGSCTLGAVNLLTGDPMLGPLADNGGLSLSHAPLSGSALVDAGTNFECASTDQTGMPRPIDGDSDGDVDCDIGSVEFVDLFAPLASLAPVADIIEPGATTIDLVVTYTELDGQVNTLTAGTSDLSITPGPLVIQSVALSGTPEQLSVNYSVLAPSGGWSVQQNGSYTIAMIADEILDSATTGPNAVAAGNLGSFTVAISEIDILGGDVSIADGDSTPSSLDNTDLGDVTIGTPSSQTFSIVNTGAGTLTLTSPQEVFGQGFTIVQAPVTALASNESTTFSVVFSPTAAGEVVGQVTIINSDADESPYTFAVRGNGIIQSELIFQSGFEQP